MNTSLSMNLFALRSAYLNNEISVSEVVEEVLRRIALYEGHNIWISRQSPEILKAQAAKLEQLDPRQLPLYGVPFAIKDNIDYAGLPTTAACVDFSYLPEETAFAVQRLIDAGALLIGKTNMDQFATGLTGTRSPEAYGICKNSLQPDYISGGSSSGSAVAVALAIVSFSLGTDTAGSGRIPAAFNNIVGLKPTRGLISCSGVLPACKSLDCVSVFSRSAAEAEYVLVPLLANDLKDIYARKDRRLLAVDPILPAVPGARFGVPKPEQLKFFGDEEGRTLFARTLSELAPLGEIVELDFQLFLDAASLLYEGPWIAERYAGIRDFIDAKPDRLHPVVLEVLATATDKNAIEAFAALHRLQALKHEAYTLLEGLTCMVVPTAPRIYRIDEVLADPVRLNSNLGYYTNFMNLLDLCAVALPAGFYHTGLPFGVTLFSSALSDARLLDLAKYLERLRGAGSEPAEQGMALGTASSAYQRLAVCGAHMSGLPLNRQLLELGGRFYAKGRTAPCYRLYALTLAPPERPGLIRDERLGGPIDLELWELPKAHWAEFIEKIKSPLCIGSVELDNGLWEYGFLCESYPLSEAKEITGFGGWRNYQRDKETKVG